MWGRKRWPMGNDSDQPWIIYTGTYSDWLATLLGKSRIEAWCLRCNKTETLVMKLPRRLRTILRQVAERDGAKHAVRVEHLRRHWHGGPAPEMTLAEVQREVGKLENWRADR